jgi:hypothetical protein
MTALGHLIVRVILWVRVILKKVGIEAKGIAISQEIKQGPVLLRGLNLIEISFIGIFNSHQKYILRPTQGELRRRHLRFFEYW